MTRGKRSRSGSHTYRWKLWALLPSLLTFVPGILVVSVGMVIFGNLILRSLQLETLQGFGLAVVVLLGVMLVPMALYVMIGILTLIGRLFLSYLRVTPKGLEYRNWPTYGIRGVWEDVERLGKYRSISGLVTSDALFLHHAIPVGPQLAVALRRMLKLSTPFTVPLTGIQGWPHGKLSDDLRRYIPHIVDGPHEDEQAQDRDESDSSGRTEERVCNETDLE